MSTLVTFFSAEGTTKKVAQEFAQSIGADVFEIVPVEPYTKAQLRWVNPVARCNKEKFGGKEVPVAGKVEGFENYDTVFVGFPIWYGAAPNVVNTFCSGYDWKGKKVYAFATSGGSGIGKTAQKLMPYVEGAAEVDAVLVKSAGDLKGWHC